MSVVVPGVASASRRSGDPPKAFCKAAARFEKEIEREAVNGGVADVDRQIKLVEKLHEEAPPKIRRETKTFLDAMRKVEDDPSIRDDPKVKRAVDAVNRFFAQGCGSYKRSQPGL